ncbi:galactosylgalactosylxylosylprotein 3-beta-glucuronosyltransferase 1-like [Symsagittifera roscoffensis]|uniref:galactosylgalactosylxylosylprotein 3-beta-glucuronosyltransferase 1-like n=1 Tax=Symsagittifera roscoffensis TaxID=84072 RepID=UPI00307BC310
MGCIQRYDPKRVYLIFILSFCLYIWFNSAKWSLPHLNEPSCLPAEIKTGAGELILSSGKNNKQYLFVVTPTYNRITQLPDMLRMKQSFLLLDNVVWIVIEDSGCRHSEVYELIKDFPLLIYINQKLSGAPSSYNKGAQQRNLAIKLLQSHFSSYHNSVVYFADDDNTYNSMLLPRLFKTKNISVFNVGLINEDVEGPVSNDQGNFVNWRTRYPGKFFNKERKFCIDMAGFAVSVKQLIDSNALFDPKGVRGYLETDFLEMFPIQLHELEVLTFSISEIVAWHTRTSYMIANHTASAYVWLVIRNAFYFLSAYLVAVVVLHKLKFMKV